MKTEKRLTMALSVLVALMMLAVPLASSSNLFVDGGQTNSNGDAPVVGASTGYTITFQLNADGKSLDQVDVDSAVETLKKDVDANALGTWYKNDDGNLCLLVVESKNIQDIIKALYNVNASRVTKNGYDLISWKDTTTGELFDSSVIGSDPVEKDMTFDAQWELQPNYVEVPVTVNFDGDVKEYYKAYLADADGNIAVTDIKTSDLPAAVEKVGKLSINGVVVNGANLNSIPVYSEGKVTYGDNRELPADGKTIPSTSSLTVTYTFNSAQYSKIIVHSIAFKDGKDVMLYADKNAPYSYKMIFDALKSTDVKAIDAEPVDKSVNYKTKDGKYLLTGWDNNSANLESTYPTTATEFTLDAKLNGYNVVFMVNGQYEVKFVEFGKLNEDLCTLGTSGLNHWVWIPFNDVDADANKGLTDMTGLEGIDLTDKNLDGKTLFQTFKFTSQSNIDLVEKVAATVNSADVPSVVFVACFESPANTAYAIFNANFGNITGYFGDNENIDRIVIPGKGNTLAQPDGGNPTTNAANISKPASNPVYDGKKVFIGYGDYTADTKYGDVDSVKTFSAKVGTYEHILSFYVDGEISAKLYYNGTLAVADGKVPVGNLVAFEYEGMIYAVDPQNADSVDKALKALQPKKDGYSFTQWNDKDGKKVFSVSVSFNEDGTLKEILFETGDGYPKDGVKTDMDFYAQFDAKSYTIEYVNTFGSGATQVADVDKEIALIGEGIIVHDNFTLIGWTTSPGESGSNYDLGASFVLSGADYEKLANASTDGKVVVKFYTVWQSNGSDVPGDNTDGGNDNTALYLIAGMLAIIAILAIVGILLMRKK